MNACLIGARRPGVGTIAGGWARAMLRLRSMERPIVRKNARATARANLGEYADARRSFSWEAARRALDVPEADDPKMATLDRCVDYLAARADV